MMKQNIKAIIGLGNPGIRHTHQRHNIGFQIIDVLAQHHDGAWRTDAVLASAEIQLNGKKLLLIKPQTYMNNSGQVIPFLQKKGIKPEEILVVHDELEKPFGTISYRMGGSARGHNGLRSIIAASGSDFGRLRIGIGRPIQKEQVPDYVLQPFSESASAVEQMVIDAVREIGQLV